MTHQETCLGCNKPIAVNHSCLPVIKENIEKFVTESEDLGEIIDEFVDLVKPGASHFIEVRIRQD